MLRVLKTASKFTKSVLKSKSLKQLLNFNGVHYKDVKVCQDSIDVYATVSRKYGICPACGKRSHAVHSSYVRHLVSLPVHGKRLNIHLVTRRFRCDNTRCGQKYFSEQLAGVSSRYSRRTPCATERLEKLFLEVSARKGAYLSRELDIPVSASTGLRILARIPIEDPCYADIRHVCIDDFATRKGMSYGTMIVECVSHKVLDVFEGRTMEQASKVLAHYPYLETVSRDRAEAYSGAISIACPQAVQIADRFHLVKNINEHIVKQMKASQKDIREEAFAVFRNGIPLIGEEQDESREITGKRYFYHIKGLMEKGLSSVQICKKYHYQKKIVLRCVKEIRRSEPQDILRVIDTVLNNRKLKLYLTNTQYGVDKTTGECSYEHIRMNQVIDASPTLMALRTIYTSFRRILIDQDVGKLDCWLQVNKHSSFNEIISFVKGIQKDIEAVKNALTYSFSNGPIEGMNNKLKTIKRAMYGRAGYRLLMLKMRLSQTG